MKEEFNRESKKKDEEYVKEQMKNMSEDELNFIAQKKYSDNIIEDMKSKSRAKNKKNVGEDFGDEKDGLALIDELVGLMGSRMIKPDNKYKTSFLVIYDTESYVHRDLEDSERHLHTTILLMARVIEFDRRTNEIVPNKLFDKPVIAYNSEQFALKLLTLLDIKTPSFHEVVFYAHNHQYDLNTPDRYGRTFYDSMSTVGGWDLTIPADNNKWMIGKWNGMKTMFIDSMLYINISLSKIGAETQPDSFFKKMPKTDEEMREWREYCWKDVEILAKLVLRFLKETNKNTKIPITATTGAYTKFLVQHLRDYESGKFDHRNNVMMRSDKTRRVFAKMAYYGGKTEIYHKVTKEMGKKLYSLDVNSMYAYVMRNYKTMFCYMPSKFDLHDSGGETLTYSKNKYLALMKQIEDAGTSRVEGSNVDSYNQSIVAEVSLDIPEDVLIHPIPRRGDINKRINTKGDPLIDEATVYPVGEFQTVLTTPEIMLAHNRGWIKGIKNSVMYENEDIFSTFIDDIYGKRQATKEGKMTIDKKIENIVQKTILTHAYGRFGISISSTRPYDERKRDNPFVARSKEQLGNLDWIGHVNVPPHYHSSNTELNKSKIYSRKGGKFFTTYPKRPGNYAMPEIAAQINAQARLFMFDIMEKIPFEHIYYTDTDSIIVDEEGLNVVKNMTGPDGDPLINESKLGYLSIEENKMGYWDIVHPKVYSVYEDYRKDGIDNLKFSAKKGISKNNRYIGGSSYETFVIDGYKFSQIEQGLKTYSKNEIKDVRAGNLKGIETYNRYLNKETGDYVPLVLNESMKEYNFKVGTEIADKKSEDENKRDSNGKETTGDLKWT